MSQSYSKSHRHTQEYDNAWVERMVAQVQESNVNEEDEYNKYIKKFPWQKWIDHDLINEENTTSELSDDDFRRIVVQMVKKAAENSIPEENKQENLESFDSSTWDDIIETGGEEKEQEKDQNTFVARKNNIERSEKDDKNETEDEIESDKDELEVFSTRLKNDIHDYVENDGLSQIHTLFDENEENSNNEQSFDSSGSISIESQYNNNSENNNNNDNNNNNHDNKFEINVEGTSSNNDGPSRYSTNPIQNKNQKKKRFFFTKKKHNKNAKDENSKKAQRHSEREHNGQKRTRHSLKLTKFPFLKFNSCEGESDSFPSP